MALSKKQQAFIDEYFLCGMNATEAARRAGYSEKSIRSSASENLTKPDIQAEIDRRLKEKQLSADEVLARLSDMARADMRDFIKPVDVGNDRIVMLVDLGKALAGGKTHLIKKLKYNAQGGLEIELHDSQAALEKLGRHHKLFTEVQEITGSVGSYNMTKDEWLKAQQDRRKQVGEAIADFEDEPVDE
jgi:phage terminase small subunit